MLKVLFLISAAMMLIPSGPARATVADRRAEIEGDWVDEDAGQIEGLVDNVIYQGSAVSADEMVAHATYQLELRLPEVPDLYRPQCSGTMIANDVFLTAGHCIPTRSEVGLYVRYGAGKRIKVVETILHPQFLARTAPGADDRTRHDIAILRLAKPVPGAVPALIPSRKTRLNGGQQVLAAGYGMNGRPQTLKELMRFPEVKELISSGRLIVPATEEAQKDFAAHLVTMASVLPLLKTDATARLSSADPSTARLVLSSRQSLCHGDSGGPTFVKQSSGKLVILGVHSSGTNTECKTTKSALIFTRPESSFDVFVPDYADWIQNTLEKMKAIDL